MQKNNTASYLLIALIVLILAPIIYIAIDQNKPPITQEKRLFAIYQHNTSSRNWMPLKELLTPYGVETAAITAINKPMPIPTSAEQMIEVNEYAKSIPTPEQKLAARNLYEATRQAAIDNNWFSYKKANADGYNRQIDDVHYFNTQFMTDGNVLNPQKPEFLMFYDTPKGKLLVGAMFVTETQFAHGPQPGGSDTIWHYHIQPNTCWEKQVPLTGFCELCDKLLTQNNKEHSHHHNHEHSADAQPFKVTTELAEAFSQQIKCKQGTLYHRSPEMLHVWFIEHPQGQFATNMGIPDELFMENKFIVEHADKK